MNDFDSEFFNNYPKTIKTDDPNKCSTTCGTIGQIIGSTTKRKAAGFEGQQLGHPNLPTQNPLNPKVGDQSSILFVPFDCIDNVCCSGIAAINLFNPFNPRIC